VGRSERGGIGIKERMRYEGVEEKEKREASEERIQLVNKIEKK